MGLSENEDIIDHTKPIEDEHISTLIGQNIDKDYIELRSRDIFQSSSRRNSRRGKAKVAEVQSLLVGTSDSAQIESEEPDKLEETSEDTSNEEMDKVDKMIESAWQKALNLKRL